MLAKIFNLALFLLVCFWHLPLSAITITSQAQLEATFDSNTTFISDNLQLEGTSIVDLSPLKNVHTIAGNFYIHKTGLLNTDGLESLEYALRIFISENNFMEDIHLPSFQDIFGNFAIYQNPILQKVSGTFPKFHDGVTISLYDNPFLEDISIFSQLAIAGSLTIFDCPNINNLVPLGNITEVRNLRLENFPLIPNLNFLLKLEYSRSITLVNFDQVLDLSPLSQLTVDELDYFELSGFTNLVDLAELENWNFPIEQIIIHNNSGLKNLKGLNNIPWVGDLEIVNNLALNEINFGNLTEMHSILISNNDSLKKINGLQQLDTLNCGLVIESCSQLADLSDLNALVYVQSFNCPTYFNQRFLLKNLPALSNQNFFPNLTFIGDDLMIENCGMDSLYGFNNLANVGDDINIMNNPNLQIIGDIFSNLVTCEALAVSNSPMLNSLNIPTKVKNLELFAIRNCPILPAVNGMDSLQLASVHFIDLPNLLEVSGLKSLHSISLALRIENCALSNLDQYLRLDTISGFLQILNNANLQTISTLNETVFMAPMYEIKICNNDKLLNLEGFDNLTHVEYYGIEILNNELLHSLNGFENLESTNGWISIKDNPSLSDISGFANIDKVGDSLIISNNSSLTDISTLSSLDSVGAYLQISNNINLNDCEVLCHLDSIAYIGEGIILENNADSCSVLDSVLQYCQLPNATYSANKINFSIFPNPTTGPLTIEGLEEFQGSIYLYSNTGVLLEQHQIRNLRGILDLSAYHPGFYYLQFLDDHGKNGGTQKVLILNK